MSRTKNILLYLTGVLLLVFGNKSAISALSGKNEQGKQPSEKSGESSSSMFGTIELNKSNTNSINNTDTDTKTVIETEDVETATASE